jgi:hypothetical protein
MFHHCTFQCPVFRLLNIHEDEEITQVSRFNMRSHRKKQVLRSLLEFWKLSPYASRYYREGEWPQHESNQHFGTEYRGRVCDIPAWYSERRALKSRFEDGLSSDVFFFVFIVYSP